MLFDLHEQGPTHARRDGMVSLEESCRDDQEASWPSPNKSHVLEDRGVKDTGPQDMYGGILEGYV